MLNGGDCAMDDADRDKGILIEVKTPLTTSRQRDYKTIKAILAGKYDSWVRETR